MRLLRNNTAIRITVGPFFDQTDGVTPEVALTVTSEKLTFMVDDANVPTLVLDTAPTASGGANDMIHVSGDDAGFYDLELAAANVNYFGRAMLALTNAAAHCPVFHEFMIVPAMIYDSLILGTDRLDANVTHAVDVAWASGAITAAVLADNAIDRATFAADTGLQSIRSNTAQAGAASTITLDASASAVNSFYNSCSILLTGGTGAGQFRIITGYVGATKVATVDLAWATNPDNTTTFAIFPAAASASDIGTAVWATAARTLTAATNITSTGGTTVPQTGDSFARIGATGSGLTSLATPTNITAGTITTATNVTTVNGLAANVITAASINAAALSAAKFAADTGLVPIRSNTAQAGAATTITLDASASASNSFYNNALIAITGGTGVGQARFITAYVGATKVATVATWVTNPDNTSTFAILPFDAVAGASVPTVAQIATGVWQDTTAGDFTTAGSIGRGLFTSGALPGAAGGVFIAGTNAATAITTGLTTTFTGNLTGSVGSVTGNVGGNLGGTLTTSERNAIADAQLDRADAIETGLTPRQAHRLEVAAAAGKVSGAATTTVVLRNAVADSKARVTATVDVDGNRTAVTTDVT